MLHIVIPVFLVILVGYVFGRNQTFSPESEKLINVYVLFISLPALLFLAVAQSNPAELTQWSFLIATLAGIAASYIVGLVFAYFKKVNSPYSSLIAMSSCYGTTGYMGIPIVIAAFGSQAAVPAAIATILHNIPAIMSVIVTHDIHQQKNARSAGLLSSIKLALMTTLKNPLTIAVIAGMVFSILHVPVPEILASFAKFLSAAAGPTALFALGLGLSRIRINASLLRQKATWVIPVVLFKIALQPAVTLVALLLLGEAKIDIWFATAIVMAAQPIGAGAYVFASKYEFFAEETSIAIIVSLVPTLVSIALILQFFNADKALG